MGRWVGRPIGPHISEEEGCRTISNNHIINVEGNVLQDALWVLTYDGGYGIM